MAFAYDEVYDEMKKTTAVAPKNANEPKKVSISGLSIIKFDKIREALFRVFTFFSPNMSTLY